MKPSHSYIVFDADHTYVQRHTDRIAARDDFLHMTTSQPRKEWHLACVVVSYAPPQDDSERGEYWQIGIEPFAEGRA